ncbi:Na+/H+ antiporter subunit E [Azonexus sp.]|jgi:multicomponent Na+:H+ antiporter subunit E|uniref:Na+/H+ antiporter subunit E n=1 Tax=Azonexus sp. TaxID=1872668 RepID=UPI0035B3A67E
MSAAIACRLPGFALLWWILGEGRADSWWLGAPAIAAALWLSLRLSPPAATRFSPAALPAFIIYFLRNSLLGGVQVARLALAGRGALRPGLLELRLGLQSSLARHLMTGLLGLMPGTLSVRLDGDSLLVHVLDRRLPVAAEAEKLAGLLARLFGEGA